MYRQAVSTGSPRGAFPAPAGGCPTDGQVHIGPEKQAFGETPGGQIDFSGPIGYSSSVVARKRP